MDWIGSATRRNYPKIAMTESSRINDDRFKTWTRTAPNCSETHPVDSEEQDEREKYDNRSSLFRMAEKRSPCSPLPTMSTMGEAQRRLDERTRRLERRLRRKDQRPGGSARKKKLRKDIYKAPIWISRGDLEAMDFRGISARKSIEKPTFPLIACPMTGPVILETGFPSPEVSSEKKEKGYGKKLSTPGFSIICVVSGEDVEESRWDRLGGR
uniref:Uncharacterized protein n=1 Tax=Caenorhabditis tropicalis TaxID=1561998 RepID=A0A1I7TD44_9PELO